mmetsp:Transcript_23739/g.34882  ORF Transcript_23739/g.34882 Transcript_23739/m.34882 type:complete len:662 (-) Transcript_23739:92-2077(-)
MPEKLPSNVTFALFDLLLPVHLEEASRVFWYYIEHYSTKNDNEDNHTHEWRVMGVYKRFVNSIGYIPSPTTFRNVRRNHGHVIPHHDQQQQQQYHITNRNMTKRKEQEAYEHIITSLHEHVRNELTSSQQCEILPKFMLSLVRHALNPKVSDQRIRILHPKFAELKSVEIFDDLSNLVREANRVENENRSVDDAMEEEGEKKKKSMGSDGLLDLSVYEKVLQCSNYLKNGVWPFHRVLRILVSHGYKPEPSTVLNLLHNDHPYIDPTRTYEMLSCILRLDRETSSTPMTSTSSNQYEYYDNDETMTSSESSNMTDFDNEADISSSSPPQHKYQIDLGTLESITTSAAISAQFYSKQQYRAKPKKRNQYKQVAPSKLILLIWDMMEHFYPNKAPTEKMYEDAIIVFSNEYKQDHNVFQLLHDMEMNAWRLKEGEKTEGEEEGFCEDDGMEEGGMYVPKRGLIEGVAKCLSTTSGRVDNAYYMLTNRTPGTSITTSSFNCILGACAKLGLVDSAFATYEDFEAYGLKPDANTFSYLMECLAVDLNNNDDKDEMTFHIEAAEEVFSLIHGYGIGITHHILKHYVQIQCACGNLQAARSAIEDTIENGDDVCVDSIAIVSQGYASLGKFDEAESVAALAEKSRYGSIPLHLTKSIEKMKNEHSLR